MSILIDEINGYIKRLEITGKCPDTIANNRCHLKIFYKYIGDVNTEDITLEMVLGYMRYLTEKPGRHGGHASMVTVSARMRTVRMFFKWLDVYRNIKPFDWSLIVIPSSNGQRTTILTEDEIHRIINAINCRHFEGVRLRAMIETYVSTGARLSGIINLKLNDINLETREAIIRKKGGGYQTVYLNDRSVRWITEYLSRRDDDCPYLWVSRKNSTGVHKLRANCFGQQITQLREHANIGKEWSCHTFRHSFATYMLQKGANVREVQELLGHKSLNSTMIYTHIANIDLKAVHNRLMRI